MSAMIKAVETQPESDLAVCAWLAAQVDEQHPTLLAFADDGVIWGRKVNGSLKTCHDIDNKMGPELRGETLQEAFVFGAAEEIRLFRDELGNWKALRVMDGENVIKESQILWGDELVGISQDGFSRIKDNSKGIPDQLVPLEVKALAAQDCIRLDVHHLVEINQNTGEARIALSRLAGLRVGLRTEVVK